MEKISNYKITKFLMSSIAVLVLIGCTGRRTVTDPDYKVLEVHRPTLSHHVPLSNAVNINRDTDITIWFSDLMDETSVVEHFQIWPHANLDSVLTMSISDEDLNEIYIGRRSLGVFKSRDNAESWNWITSSNLRMTFKKIAVAKSDANVVYAATDSGMYKSTDRGTSWNQINSGLTDLVINSIAIDPENADILFVTTSMEGVFKSEDGGTSWIAKNSGVRTGRPLYDIIFNPNNSNILFIATDGNYILKSEDGGENWARLRDGLNSRNYYSLAVHPVYSNVVFAGSSDNGINRSGDNGDHWVDISTNLGNLVINSLAVNPGDTNILYAGTESGLYKTINAGEMSEGVNIANWTLLGTDWGDVNISTVLAHSSDSLILFTCIPNDGIYRSTDGGNSWTKKNNILIDNLLVSGSFQFEIWHDTTVIITPIDSVLSDTTIIHPYVLTRALDGWDGTGEPPVEIDPDATKMIFTPDTPLLPDCRYRARVKGKFESDDETLQPDPSAAMDVNGNSLESDANFYFTTGKE